MQSSRVPNLRKRRLELNLLQKDLADRLHTTQDQISNYESGKSSPRAEVLKELAEILNTTTDYLVGLSDNPARPIDPLMGYSADIIHVANFMATLSPARQAFLKRIFHAAIDTTQAFDDDEIPK